MTTRRRKKHHPEEVAARLRDADEMLDAGKDPVAMSQALEIIGDRFRLLTSGDNRLGIISSSLFPTGLCVLLARNETSSAWMGELLPGEKAI